MNPSDSFITLPNDVRWDTEQDTTRPEIYDMSWPPADEPDRLVTLNYSNQVIVCLPAYDYPQTWETTPVYSVLSSFTEDFETEDVADLLDAVPATFEKAKPTRCWYGVKYGHVQTFGNSPELLLSDLMAIDGTRLRADGDVPVATSLLAEPGAMQKATLVAACWPLGDDQSWFVLEGYRFDGFGESEFLWHYGLWFANPPLDPSAAVEDFFDPITDHPPKYLKQWSQRRLIVRPRIQRPPLTKTATIEAGLEYERFRPALYIHGTNPLYGTPPEAVVDDYRSIERIFYEPLKGTSTLLWDLDYRGSSEKGYELQELIVLGTPTARSVFVLAEVGPHWG